MFGVAEDHDSNPIKIGLGKLKGRGAKFVSVNPIRTGYSGIADEWIGIRPGTDGLLVMALIHELLKAGRIDEDYLVRYTNVHWLVLRDPGGADHGLYVRDEDGVAQCWDGEKQALASSASVEAKPIIMGEVTLPDGRVAVPSFQVLAEQYLDPQYAPEAVADITGISAATIKRIAAELARVAFEEAIELPIAWTDWAGRRHDKVIGRPVSMHAMRGISAHSNGFHTCCAIHILQLLLGTIDVPGGMRYKPPYPKALYSLPKPYGREREVTPNTPMSGPHLGFPMAPEELLVDAAADAIRHPVVAPDRDVRPFQDVLLDLGARLGLAGMIDEKGDPKYPGGYADYMTNHQRRPGIGPLAGWRGEDGDEHGRGAPNPDQLQRYIENEGFWEYELPEGQRYHRYANRDYLDWAHHMGFVTNADQIVMKIYSEAFQKFRLAAEGHGALQPPEHLRARLREVAAALPIWYPPIEETLIDPETYPLHALTQRPMQMYHSWGSQNAWLRQITGENRLYMAREKGAELGIEDGDWVWVGSHNGRIKVQAALMDGVNPNTVWTWNAIGKRAGAWNLDPDAAEARKGFLLNHLISETLPGESGLSNSDPLTGQAAWFDLRVRVEKAKPEEQDATEPRFEPTARPPRLPEAPGVLRYGESFRRAREGDRS